MSEQLIGRRLDVHETLDQVRILDGHKLLARYPKYEHGKSQRAPVSEGLHRRGPRKYVRPPSREEQLLRGVDPTLARLIAALKKRDGGRPLKAVRRLHRMYIDYPTEILVQALRDVADYGLIDLLRIEKVVLRRLAGDFFRMPIDDDKEKPS